MTNKDAELIREFGRNLNAAARLLLIPEADYYRELADKAQLMAHEMEKAEPVGKLVCRYGTGTITPEPAIMKFSEGEFFLYTHADTGEVERLKAELEMVRHSHDVQVTSVLRMVDVNRRLEARLSTIKQAVEKFQKGGSVFDSSEQVRFAALGCIEDIEAILNTINQQGERNDT